MRQTRTIRASFTFEKTRCDNEPSFSTDQLLLISPAWKPLRIVGSTRVQPRKEFHCLLCLYVISTKEYEKGESCASHWIDYWELIRLASYIDRGGPFRTRKILSNESFKRSFSSFIRSLLSASVCAYTATKRHRLWTVLCAS